MKVSVLQRLALISLIVMGMVWGSTFFSIKALVARMPVADMLAERFTVGAAVLGVCGWRHWRMSRRTFRQGLALGLLWGGSQLFQTFGMGLTSASNSGFVTGLYVVFTPLLGALLLRERVSRLTMAAVGLATIGLAVLSVTLSGGFTVGPGEVLVLVSAAGYAAHIVAASSFSTQDNAVSLALVQTVVTALICWVAAAPGGVTWPAGGGDWLWLLYFAVIAGSLTIFLQIWAQAHVAPTKAAVIMATEPLWAALFAVAFGGETVTWRMLVGGSAIFVAMMMVICAPASPVAGPREERLA